MCVNNFLCTCRLPFFAKVDLLRILVKNHLETSNLGLSSLNSTLKLSLQAYNGKKVSGAQNAPYCNYIIVVLITGGSYYNGQEGRKYL